MSRFTKTLPAFLPLLLLTLYTTPISAEEAQGDSAEPAAAHGPAGGGAPPAPGVTFVEVSPEERALAFDRLGVVEASRLADVHARVEGYIAERHFEEGQYIEAGSPLYTIEQDSFEAVAQMREADLRDAELRLELAVREHTRSHELRETGAVTQETLDNRESEKNRASAAVARAEAALREARLELKYTNIVAPVSGIVGKAMRDVGDYVDTGSNSMLTSVTRISPIYVTYGISEREYWRLADKGDLKLDEGVSFRIQMANGEEFEEVGKLNYLSPSFEPSTGMLRVRVEFPNKNHVLRPNQFVKIVENHGMQRDVIAVPKKSVIQSPMGAAVFVIDESDTLQFRPVAMGEWWGDRWIVASGLQPGERVMVDGLLKSQPGAPVSPRPYVADTATQ